MEKRKIWYCKIGECNEGDLPSAADLPMREAIEKAYREVTGRPPHFIFSGWGAELTKLEREVIDDGQTRDPVLVAATE